MRLSDKHRQARVSKFPLPKSIVYGIIRVPKRTLRYRMNASFDYSRWSDSELARANHTAEQFLTENQSEISHVLSRQRGILDVLLALLQRRDLSLEERLDCFARIAETAESMRECANGFFELGAQPLVARAVETGSLY